MDNNNPFANMMNLASLFIPSPSSKTSSAGDNATWKMSPIDAEIHTEPLRICKCLLPYLPYERQKSVSVALKLFELVSVMQYYSEPNILNNSMMRAKESENWQIDLLNSIRHNLDPSHAYLVDILFKLNDMRKILAAVQSNSYIPPTQTPNTPLITNTESLQNSSKDNSSSNNSPKEIVEKLSPMLDDNQRKILETLSTIMK